MTSSSNIFTPIDGDVAPAQIPHSSNHPVPRTGIKGDLTKPLHTNKFHANLFLGTQGNPVWTHPYSLQWAKGQGNAGSWGMGISHIDTEKIAFAPGNPPVQYYINPLGIHSLLLSATELGSSTQLTTDSLQPFSANANLASSPGVSPILTIPLVQGQGFVTGVYKNATPNVQSSILYRSISKPVMIGTMAKYRVVLEDGYNWLIYVIPTDEYNAASFTNPTNHDFIGPAGFKGIIQIAKNPAGSDGEAIYDKSAGSYVTSATLSGATHANGSMLSGTYGFTWTKQGTNPLLMFALPHHVQSFDSTTAAAKTGIQLRTTTKGMATAILSDKMALVEPNLPTGMGFAPWSPSIGQRKFASARAIQAMNNAASVELNVTMSNQTNLDSMYYAGKALAKFAQMVYALNDLGNNTQLATSGLNQLKVEFNRFVQNQQKNPLVYDDSWKGVVSSAGYKDPGQDFGNTYYNDHHFHYGYFVYAAAVIGYLDPSWVTQDTNKAWVQMLVKDFANSDVSSPNYPFSRAFDWYHGHSWAKGLFESGDGKDQESSSEDAFASYGLKMWGKIIGDANMEARGNLMLSVQARSFQSYFLMESNNTNQPAQILGNKVTGILFENKVDHATYFGTNPEYIQGIHMLPLAPPSLLIRTKKFVQEEWSTYFEGGKANVTGGWRGILYANLALVDPTSAYEFFEQGGFDYGWLDGGASRTWYLAWCAALGGA